MITVYVVLGILYESLIHPFTILSTLPSAGVGAAAGPDGVTGVDLSLVAFASASSCLMGIVLAKNAIMMVDLCR